MNSYELYYSIKSPYARRIRVLLEELKIPYEGHFVDVHQAPSWYFSINPVGRVPALKTPEGTCLSESWHILDHFRDRFGDRDVFLTKGRDLDRCRAISGAAMGIIDFSISHVLESFRPESLQSKTHSEDALFGIKKGLAFLEGFCLDTDLSGDHFATWDIDLACALGYLEFRISKNILDSYPRLKYFFSRVKDRPSMAKTIPVA